MAADEKCAQSLFVRDGKENALKPTGDLISDLSGKLTDEFQLKRWDGELGTYKEHLDWMYEHTKTYTDTKKGGFRHHGEHNGVIYEIHDELTAEGGGDGYFRLSGEINIPAELVIAQVMDATSLGEMDPTVMYMNFLHTYSDQKSRLCMWIAAPGFPFDWRMGLDLTAWRVDEDGTYWQYSLSVPEELRELPSLAIRSVDRYWGYRVVPLDGGKRCRVVLICQTNLFGWIPQFLVNMKIGEVLADYIGTVEKRGLDIIASGQATSFVETVLGSGHPTPN